MFKKPPTLKTSAPLRASDRRKFRALVADTFLADVPPDVHTPDIGTEGKEDGGKEGKEENGKVDGGSKAALAEMLVPEGLMSAKFATANKAEHGVRFQLLLLILI